MSLKIYFIIIENGRIGETHFAPQGQQHNKYLQERALSELYSSDILEWYRNQYNIPLQEFYAKNIDEDIAFIDFYRRQYWTEIRYGVRKWGDPTLEFQIPPFTLYRGNGGVLPPPNGYGYDGHYSVKVDHYKASQEDTVGNLEEAINAYNQQRSSADNQYSQSNPIRRPIPRRSDLQYEDEVSVYKSSKDDFEEMLKQSQESEEFWQISKKFL